jgi:hypothetical protein
VTSDLVALQSALAAEHAAVYGYGVVGAYLGGAEQDEAKTDWHAHLLARDELVAMITRLGGTPTAAHVAYELPLRVTDPRTARLLAIQLEDGVTRAYLAVVAVRNQPLREWAAMAMRPPALRAARWRGATLAFPGLGAGGS